MKHQLKVVIYYSGLAYLIRLVNSLRGRRVTILTFHRIAKAGDSGLPTISVTYDNFQKLAAFVARHYEIISMTQYLELAKAGARPARHTLVLTFDDGCREVLEHGLPILEALGLPAVMFIPTGTISNGGVFWWDTVFTILSSARRPLLPTQVDDSSLSETMQRIPGILALPMRERKNAVINLVEELQNAPPNVGDRLGQLLLEANPNLMNRRVPRSALSWAEVTELARRGFEIGSHTVTHRFLHRLSTEEVRRELEMSRQDIEQHLGIKTDIFSYPGGKYNPDIAAVVAETGHVCGCTTDDGINSSDEDVFRLKRVNIWDEKVVDARGRFSKAATAWSLFAKW